MSDWIEQLERLTALHKAGALTDEEFAAQKARLLEARDAAPAAPPPPADWDAAPAAAGGVPKWLLIGAPALLVLAGAAWFGSSLVGGGPDPDLAAGPSGAASDGAVAVATPSEAPPMPVALDGSLKFSSPSLCEASGALEAIYKKLDTAGELGSGKGITIKLDAWDNPLPISAKSSTDKDGIETRDAGLKFPEATTWHGLKLSRLTTQTVIVPDSDGGYTRTVNFLEPADKVQKTLARLGFGAPKAPDFSELAGEGCGGSAQIVTLDGGSALSCSWGC
ncbi:SHOCT domain-containing protein [Novosphingobium sp.]|uniref:SHOCT domain-containing protein n=1 Tax=Novosphingobium sp. TaxID=1874826 RepID=UPI0025F2E32E|nr:SHOCT domain-containing protein [Novosphingobium sp.]MCC6924541.1 SHOCT domain-containing protein [Novosphingobium sp.]